MGKAAGFDLERAKRDFLAQLAVHGVVSKACEASGLTRSAAYRLKDEDADFARRWDEALAVAAENAEHEAFRRAQMGVEKFVISKGQVVAHPVTGEPLTETAYSDRLLELRLRALMPDKYRDRSSVSVETVGGVLSIDPNKLMKLSSVDRAHLVRILEQLAEEEHPNA